MRSSIGGRRNAFGAGALSLILVTAMVVVAARTDGYRAAHVDLNDASVWISGSDVSELHEAGTSGLASAIGRVNTSIGKINFNVTVPNGSTLFQDGDTTLYLKGASVQSVDGASQQTGRAVVVGGSGADSVAMAVGGGRVAVLNESGDVWLTSTDRISTGLGKGAPAVQSVEGGSLLVVGTDGNAYTYRPGANVGYRITPSGGKHRWSLPDASSKMAARDVVDGATDVGQVQLSVVGSTPAVLDGPRHRVLVSGGSAVPLGSAGDAALQQPGPALGGVQVTTAKGLVTVPLHGSSVRTETPRGAGVDKDVPIPESGAVRPVVVQGCVYAAWTGQPFEQRYCPAQRQYDFSAEFGRSAPDAELVFRVNHDRVVLNDIEHGAGWVLTRKNQSEPVEGWLKKITQRKQSRTQKSVDLPNPKRDCSKDRADAKLKPPQVNIGARVGVPTTLSIGRIKGLPSPKCRVLDITKVSLPASSGTAQVSGVGDSIQFVLKRPGTATATYTVSDGVGEPAQGTISIAAKAWSASGDKSPNSGGDRNPTYVVPGGTVSYNALDLASDPDGDPINLVKACVGSDSSCQKPAGNGVQYQPNGWIRYTAPQGASGSTTLNFVIADPWGKTSTGSVGVIVKQPTQVGPVTHDDRATVVAGHDTVVNVLGNDVSPSGKPLRLATQTVQSASGMSTAKAQSVVSPGNTQDTANDLLVDAQAPVGEILVKYTVTDDQSATPAEGYARIRVVAAPKGSPKPVAMLDTAVARPRAQVMVDVTANDFDSGGDVLAVTGVSTDTSDGGAAQLMPDGHTVRITAPNDFVPGARGHQPMKVAYDVSNGKSTAQGLLLVSPSMSTENLAPFTVDDTASLRVGKMMSIPVSANDTDPEGSPLYLKSVRVLSAGQDVGSAFVEGDEVRFVAPSKPGQVKLEYTVSDAPLAVRGNVASGQVLVNVLPDGSDNPPNALALTARAIQGQRTHIDVPLLSADPDGDIVGISGVKDSPPQGKLEVVGDGFWYTPADDQAGTTQFTFRLSDGQKSSVSTVRVGVMPGVSSDGPHVTPINVVMRPRQTRQIDLLDPTSVTSSSGPMRVQTTGRNAQDLPHLIGRNTGRIVGSPTADGVITYQAPQVTNQRLSVTLRYIVQGSGGSVPNIVNITVDPDANVEPPAPRDDFASAFQKGKRVRINVLANDSDPGGASTADWKVTLKGAPAGATYQKGFVSFTMPRNSVRFRYVVTAGKRTAQAIVSVPVNNGVACQAKTYRIKAGKTLTVSVADHCSAPPGQSLHLTGATIDASVGTARAKGTKVVVDTKEDALSGEYQLSTSVCIDGPDCTDSEVTALDNVVVEGTDKPPSLDLHTSVPAGGQNTVDLAGPDGVQDPNPGDRRHVSFTGVSPSQKGGIEVKLAGSMLTVSAGLKASGSETFQVGLDDGHGPEGRAKGTVTVSVTDANVTIQAVDDPETVVNDGSGVTARFDVLANDVAIAPGGGRTPDLKIARVSSVSPSSASARVQGDQVVFQPATGYGGDASFSYTAALKDGGAKAQASSTATVSVHVVGKPGQPNAPVGTDKQDRQVTLKWTPPSGNGGPIDYYRVECVPASGGGTCPGSPRQETGSSVTYTGLTNGTSYKFRVTAHNEAGFGTPSDWSQPWTPDKVPQAPQITKVGDFDGHGGGDASGHQLTVHWTPPANPGSPITGYKVSWTGPTSGANPNVGSGATDFTATGLESGSYQFQVVATNDAGDSAPGISGAQSTIGVPDAPTGVDAEPDPVHVQLLVAWQPPSGNGDDNLTYHVTASPTGGGASPEPQTITSGNNAIFTDVAKGTTYDVAVTAKNRAGTGSAGTGHGVARGSSDPVEHLTVSPTDSAALLQFTNPTNTGGSPIDHYLVSYGGSTQSVQSSNPSAGATASIQIGAVNGTPVGPFSVRVCNLWAGQDTARCSSSQTAGQVTPFGAPDQGRAATLSGGLVRYTWENNGIDDPSVDCMGGTLTADPRPPTTNPHPSTATTSATCDYGNGAQRSVSATITASSPGATPRSLRIDGTTEDTRHVEVTWGSSGTDANCSSNCFHIVVTATGMSSDSSVNPYEIEYYTNYVAYTSVTGSPTTYQVVPDEYCVNTGDRPDVNCITDQASANGSGNFTVTSSWLTQKPSGIHIQVVVDGITVDLTG